MSWRPDDNQQYFRPEHVGIAAQSRERLEQRERRGRYQRQHGYCARAAAATGSTSNTDSTLSNLETSFQNLVSAVGGTDGSATARNNFLSALASPMDGASSVGNLVSTQA